MDYFYTFAQTIMLSMSWFKRAKSNIIEQRSFNFYSGDFENFMPVHVVMSGRWLGARKEREAYDLCPPVSTCINKIATYAQNAKFKAETKRGNEVQNDALVNLLNNPNLVESKSEFIKKYITYVKIHGFCLIWIQPKTTISYKDPSKNYLKILDPDKILNYGDYNFIKYIRAVAGWDKELEITYNEGNGKSIEIPLSQLVIVYDLFFDENILSGNSRVTLQMKNIATHIVALDCINSIQSNPSGYHIIGKENSNPAGTFTSYDPEVVKALKELEKEFNDYGRGKDKEGKDKSLLKLVNGKVSGYEISPDFKKFGTVETLKQTRDEIMAAFNISVDVYGTDNSKYENKAEAEKSVYQNEIFTSMDNLVSGLVSFFDYPNKIEACYEHLPIFQEDEKKKADVEKTEAETVKIVLDNVKFMLDNGLISKEKALQILIDEEIIENE